MPRRRRCASAQARSTTTPDGRRTGDVISRPVTASSSSGGAAAAPTKGPWSSFASLRRSRWSFRYWCSGSTTSLDFATATSSPSSSGRKRTQTSILKSRFVRPASPSHLKRAGQSWLKKRRFQAMAAAVEALAVDAPGAGAGSAGTKRPRSLPKPAQAACQTAGAASSDSRTARAVAETACSVPTSRNPTKAPSDATEPASRRTSSSVMGPDKVDGAARRSSRSAQQRNAASSSGAASTSSSSAAKIDFFLFAAAAAL